MTCDTEYDVLLLRQKGPRQATKHHISPPIRTDATIKLGYGATVKASDLLGRPIPCTISDSQGRPLRVKEVTLGQYLTNLPRVATPVRSKATLTDHASRLDASATDLPPRCLLDCLDTGHQSPCTWRGPRSGCTTSDGDIRSRHRHGVAYLTYRPRIARREPASASRVEKSYTRGSLQGGNAPPSRRH